MKTAALAADPGDRAGGTDLVGWTAVSVPVVHTRVPLPYLRMPAVPSSVPGVGALAGQARWAMQAAQANLPPTDRLLYYGGVGVMALGGLLEWPVALAAGAGVWVASRTRRRGSA